MEIGTAETIPDAEEKRKKIRRSGFSGGSNSGNGGGRNPGGGDKDDKDLDQAAAPDKSRILTTFLLLIVFMTFGGLIAAYIVISFNNAAEWKPFALPIQVWISTILILISSFTYHFAKLAVDRYNQPSAKKWLIATTVLGAAFISSQILVWLDLVNRGFYVRGNPYAGFFYILTAVHAVHVLGGMMALGAIVLRAWNPKIFESETARVRSLATVVGWYWHFMGGLWVVLFVLLGFWK